MKKTILIIGIVAIIGAVAGWMIYNKPHDDIGSAKADYELQSTELFSEYEQDEQAANAKYLDKVIQVTGKVVEVKEDEDGHIGVTLEGDGMMFGVICKLDPLSTHLRTQFEPGEVVTLKGVCTGALMDVVVERSVIIEN